MTPNLGSWLPLLEFWWISFCSCLLKQNDSTFFWQSCICTSSFFTNLLVREDQLAPCNSGRPWPSELRPRDCLEKDHYSTWMATCCGHGKTPVEYAMKQIFLAKENHVINYSPSICCWHYNKNLAGSVFKTCYKKISTCRLYGPDLLQLFYYVTWI